VAEGRRGPQLLLQLALVGFGLLLLAAPLPTKAVLALGALVAVGSVGLVLLGADLSSGLVLWLLFFPFYRGWSFLQLPGMPNLSPDRLVWLVLGGIVLVDALVSRDERYRFGAVEWAMVIFLLVTLASMVRSGAVHNRDAVGDYLNRHFIPMTLYMLARYTVRSQRQVWPILVGAGAVAVYLGITAVCEHYGISALVFPRYIMDPNVGIHFGRARGPLLQAAANGTLLGMFFPTCLFALEHVPRGYRPLFLVALFLLPVAVFFTYTRAAYLGFVLAVAFYFARSPRARRGLLVAAPLLVLVLAVLAPVLVSQYEAARSDDALPILDRLNLYATAVNMFLHAPLFGHGFYTFPVKSASYFVEMVKLPRFWVGHGTPSHNTFLEILADEGLLGFLPFMAVFAFLGLRVLRATWPDGVAAEDVRALFLSTTAALFANSFFIVQNRVVIFGFYFLMWGALTGLLRPGLEARRSGA